MPIRGGALALPRWTSALTPSGHPRRHVLFVDDDPHVLRSLERTMRAREDRWVTTFVESASEALEFLRGHEVDVIVTDMVMPGIDGGALLRAVRASWPATVRIVLTAYGEPEEDSRAIAFAHQRLKKPWSRDELIGTIERACQLRSLVGDDAMRTRLSRVRALPSAAVHYLELACEIERPSASFTSVAAIIERDMAMSAKLLQLANSAFVAPRRPVITVLDGTRTVGIDAIRRYVLSPFLDVFQVFAPADDAQAAGFAQLQRHARLTALLAQALAPTSLRSLAYVAGLIHEVGRLLIMSRMPELEAAITREAAAVGCGIVELEHRELGVTHAEIGGYLLGLWGIPPELTRAVTHHHDEGPAEPGEALTTWLRVAEWLAREHELRAREPALPDDVLITEIDEPLLRTSGALDRLPELIELAARSAATLKR